MASDDTSSSGSDGDQFSQGADRIRDTAKWLVAGFGALGSALIASLQLSSLGGLAGDGRKWALAGFGLGIVGVLIAMLSAAAILVTMRVSFAEIAKDGYLNTYIRENPELLGGYTSFGELRRTYDGYARTRVLSYSSMLAQIYRLSGDSSQSGEDSPAYTANEALYNLAQAELGLAGPAIRLALGRGAL